MDYNFIHVIMKDKNGKELQNGDVFDLGQTVNGQNLFVMMSVADLEVRYMDGPVVGRKYEYDVQEMLKPCKYSGEVDWVIVDNRFSRFANYCADDKERVIRANLDTLIEVFGKERYQNSPTVNKLINELARGTDPVLLLSNVCQIVDDQREMIEKLVTNCVPILCDWDTPGGGWVEKEYDSEGKEIDKNKKK